MPSATILDQDTARYLSIANGKSAAENTIPVTLKTGEILDVELVDDGIIGLYSDEIDTIESLIELINLGAFESYTATTDDREITSENNISNGIITSVKQDGGYYFILSFKKQPADDTAALRRQIAELLAENQELKDYADAGKIMLGEET